MIRTACEILSTRNRICARQIVRAIALLLLFPAIAFVSVGRSAAADMLAYSFEAANLDGFLPNGAGITLSQDTIGATEGAHSLKVEIVTPATFVGALTQVFNPAPGGARAAVLSG